MKTAACFLPLLILVYASSLLYGADADDLSYSVSEDSITITDCKTSASGALEIPATIEGKPVTRIGDAALRSCSSLTSVTIPDTVTRIGDESFYSCTRLTELIIPDAVTSIGASAFRYCSGLTSINIPQSLTAIEDSAFSNCGSLAGISIPRSVTVIGERAFRDCRSLTSVVIPESVISVDRLAFYGCTQLRQIHLDGQLPYFGSNVFGGAGNSYVTYSGNFTTVAGRPSFNPSQLIDVEVLQQAAAVLEAQIAELSTRPALDEVRDARAGSIMVAKDWRTGNATLRFEIEKTEDFVSWHPFEGGELTASAEGGFNLELPLDEGKNWLRVALNEEEPKPLPSREGGNPGGGIPGGFPGGIDLGGIDLGGIDLGGIDLGDLGGGGEGEGEGEGGLDLGGVDLGGLDLGELDLGGLDLGGLDLGGLDLGGLDLDTVEVAQVLLLLNQFVADISDILGLEGQEGEGQEGEGQEGEGQNGIDLGGIDLGEIGLGEDDVAGILDSLNQFLGNLPGGADPAGDEE